MGCLVFGNSAQALQAACRKTANLPSVSLGCQASIIVLQVFLAIWEFWPFFLGLDLLGISKEFINQLDVFLDMAPPFMHRR